MTLSFRFRPGCVQSYHGREDEKKTPLNPGYLSRARILRTQTLGFLYHEKVVDSYRESYQKLVTFTGKLWLFFCFVCLFMFQYYSSTITSDNIIYFSWFHRLSIYLILLAIVLIYFFLRVHIQQQWPSPLDCIWFQSPRIIGRSSNNPTNWICGLHFCLLRDIGNVAKGLALDW